MPIKEEELKQFVSEYLDINVDSIESLDNLKETFGSSFARKDVYKSELAKDPSFINPLIGKRLGTIETKIKQAAKDKLALEFDAGDFKDKSVEDLLDLVTDKAKGKFEKELGDMRSKVTGDSSEIETKFQEQLKLLREEATNWKTQAANANQEFESFKTGLIVKEKQQKLNSNLEKAFNSVKYAPEADELRKEGFKTKIMSDVKFDFDENDNFSIFDKEGKTLFHPNKAGVQYSPEDYLRDKAIEYKIYQMNPDGGKQTNQRVVTQAEASAPEGPRGRMIHPSASQY